MTALKVFWGVAGPIAIAFLALCLLMRHNIIERQRFDARCEMKWEQVNGRPQTANQRVARNEWCSRQWSLTR